MTVHATPLARTAPRAVSARPRAAPSTTRNLADARLGHRPSQVATTKCWPRPTRSATSSSPRSTLQDTLRYVVEALATSSCSLDASASVIARCARCQPPERASTSPAAACSLSRFVRLCLVLALLRPRAADRRVHTRVSLLAGACCVQLCGPCAPAPLALGACSVSIEFSDHGAAVRCCAATPTCHGHDAQRVGPHVIAVGL